MIKDKRKKDAVGSGTSLSTSSNSNSPKNTFNDFKSQATTGRTRNFATVVYPDSAPPNWVETLRMAFVPAFISPLHEDLNPDDTVKKPHHHVLLLFDNVKTLAQAKEIFDSIGGVGCEKVNSIRGYARYLCHLDNPDKVQYSPQNVTCLNGADYNNVIGLVTDKYKVISEIIDYCELNSIVSYADLLIYCKSSNFEWFRVLCDNGTMVVKEYLKSRSWSNRTRKEVTIYLDKETGEILE